MCTRFYIMPDTEEFREIIAQARESGLARRFLKAGDGLRTSGEIRPSNVLPVLAPDRDGKRAAFPMKWGFRFPGRALVVNARSETAGERPAFRESFEKRRCVVPASWYYEWEHLIDGAGLKRTGEKYLFQPRGSSVTWLCGLYRIEDGLPFFVILTREAPEDLGRIHSRMPLILSGEKAAEWIRPDADPERLMRYALTDLVVERASGREKET